MLSAWPFVGRVLSLNLEELAFRESAKGSGTGWVGALCKHSSSPGDKCQQVYLARDLPQEVTRFKAAPFGAGEVLFKALAVLGFSNGL